MTKLKKFGSIDPRHMSTSRNMAIILNTVLITYFTLLKCTTIIDAQPSDVSRINFHSQPNESLDLDAYLNDTDITDDTNQCHPMTIPFCENIGYNLTILPIKSGHLNQAEVITQINVYDPVPKTKCSHDVRLFLCSYFAPICFDKSYGLSPPTIPPCRSLCEATKRGCTPNMLKLGHAWPDQLKCDQFPEQNKTKNNCIGRTDDTRHSDEHYETLGGNNPGVTRDLGFVCPKNFEYPSQTLHLNGQNYSNCAKPCDEVILDKTEALYVWTSTLVAAIVCLTLSLFTIVSYFKNRQRFKYPISPIIYIAACQAAVAIIFLIGLLSSNRFACNDPLDPPKSLPNLKMIRTLTAGNRKGGCTLLFMGLLFFQMSTFVWWIIMTLSWFIIARLKWAPEAVSGISICFHLIAWGGSGLLAIYLSVLGNIEGDPVTGVCYVSTSDQLSIGYYVLIPICICLAIGPFFLVYGYISIYRGKELLKRHYGGHVTEHNRLITKITVFSGVFSLLLLGLLYCHHYERSNLTGWMISWLSRICISRDSPMPCPMKRINSRPNLIIIALKYWATMGFGIATGFFVMSRKTLNELKLSSEPKQEMASIR